MSKRYHGNVLFSDVSATIERGGTYGLVGPNGSGKSVLFKIICGFTRPDSGTVAIDPEFLSRDRTFPDRFGVVIDGPAYLPFKSGLDNLLELAAIRRRIGRDEVAATMSAFGLEPQSKQPVRRYSLGMKQKLALAQAFMERPAVLILDEPFNALDRDSVDDLLDKLREQHRRGTTIVFTSHERQHVTELCDHVLEIAGGSITSTAR